MMATRFVYRCPIGRSGLAEKVLGIGTKTRTTSSCGNIIELLGSRLSAVAVSCQAQNGISRTLSTVPANNSGREIVTFLGLNNLSDNPGAVKKVGM